MGSGDQHCESKSLLCPLSGRGKRKYDPFQEDQLLLLQGELFLCTQRHGGDRFTSSLPYILVISSQSKLYCCLLSYFHIPRRSSVQGCVICGYFWTLLTLLSFRLKGFCQVEGGSVVQGQRPQSLSERLFRSCEMLSSWAVSKGPSLLCWLWRHRNCRHGDGDTGEARVNI